MNKGLEMIEAKWLFNLTPEQIQVVVHPQSIIHSMVQFEDGSIKAQMGLPDMKLPIQYAMGFPKRLPNDFPRLDSIFYDSLFEILFIILFIYMQQEQQNNHCVQYSVTIHHMYRIIIHMIGKNPYTNSGAKNRFMYI
jgi:1-deoxy-D-xylulose 5-phosphate reductoisomerase